MLAPLFLALTAATPVVKGTLSDNDVRWSVIGTAVDCRTEAERGLVPFPPAPCSADRVAPLVESALAAAKATAALEGHSGSAGAVSSGAITGAAAVAAPPRHAACAAAASVSSELDWNLQPRIMKKSRYSGASSFISTRSQLKDAYNDYDIEVDGSSLKTLLAAGIDFRLAQHVAHLFARDPLVIFSERLHLNDDVDTDHFENLQSTNWQTVRWKPPPAGESTPSSIGWRVEFRSMEVTAACRSLRTCARESDVPAPALAPALFPLTPYTPHPLQVQLSDFENAAFTVIILVLSRVILFFNLNLYIPVSRVDDNMHAAHARDAVKTGRFWFRKHLVALEDEVCGFPYCLPCLPLFLRLRCCILPAISSLLCQCKYMHVPPGSDPDQVEQFTLHEILMGKGPEFSGLVPLVFAYLDIIQCDSETRSTIATYIEFVTRRASGELQTPAAWMREFISRHPDYKHDSIVTETIAHALMRECQAVGEGSVPAPGLYGTFHVEPVGDPVLGRAVSTDSAAAAALDLVDGPAPPRVRLRGASFTSEVSERAGQCALVRLLVDKYRVSETQNFAATSPFLKLPPQSPPPC